MTDIVADTDTVSFLFRGDSREQFSLPYVLNHRCIISFMTLAELEFGVLRANWGEGWAGRQIAICSISQEFDDVISVPRETSISGSVCRACFQWR